MSNVNDNTIDKYFDKMSKKLLYFKENILGEGEFLKDKTDLSKTDKEARTKARVEDMIDGKVFDESQTPPEELETIEDDIIDAILERKLDIILGD